MYCQMLCLRSLLTCQYGPGLVPVIWWMSLVNRLCPYTYMTDIISQKAMMLSPMPMYLSITESQYSPEPVVKRTPTKKQKRQQRPDTTIFLWFLNCGMSKKVPVTPSRMPICDPSPSASSMAKKRKLQKGAPGSMVNTSVMTMKASPVPWAALFSSCAMEQFLRPSGT